MRIKSYFASTIEAALDLARRELGEEAVLLNARPSPPEARHLGIHEVVFGVEREHDPQLRPAPTGATTLVTRHPDHPAPDFRASAAGGQTSPTSPFPGAPAWEALRRQVERLERTITDHLLRPPQHASALSHFLMQRDFPARLAGELAAQVEEQLASGTPAPSRAGASPRAVTPPPTRTEYRPGSGLAKPADRHRPGSFRWEPGEAAAEFRERGLVAELLLDNLQQRLANHCLSADSAPPSSGPSFVPRSAATTTIISFCGPPGGGKTTLLAKLAAIYSVERQESVAILSTDTLRISAAEQLRTYAAIMGLPCEVVETPERLDGALAEQSHRRWILIDTPGWAPAQLPEATAWAGFFAERPEIEQHLVLPAYATVRQVEAAVLRFSPFGVNRLALTRADEITNGGCLIAAVLASGLPLSYLGNGQSIPEDVEEASLERLLDLAFADESFLAAGAATAPPPARTHTATTSAHAG